MSKAVARELKLVNNMIFPPELRDAIPSHRPTAGRCLKLESVDAQAAHTVEWGRRVQVKLRVCETGKLSGSFDVWVDMQLDAARALAGLINGAAGHAEKLAPVKAWTTM
ncbi:MAG TPA: hypothetical protein VFC21_04275 [Bryobacteraceae bacterium]|nr:hypothetical protein [Bryobacteraceae bacterium]